MFAAILAALQAIPSLVNAVRDLTSAFTKYQDARWREDLNDIQHQLNSPLSIEQKAEVARKLAALISRT
jgi:uncharacterized protein YicC (UPF0701 family)